jgi:hypothetical protein
MVSVPTAAAAQTTTHGVVQSSAVPRATVTVEQTDAATQSRYHIFEFFSPLDANFLIFFEDHK